jgi:hypothetical protein
VGNAVTCRHQVQLSGANQLLRTEAIPVKDFAREQPRHSLEADVRVWPNAKSRAIFDERRTNVVREAPCAYGPAALPRKRPPDSLTIDARFAAGRDFQDRRRHGMGAIGLSGGIFDLDRATHRHSIRCSGPAHKRVP